MRKIIGHTGNNSAVFYNMENQSISISNTQIRIYGIKNVDEAIKKAKLNLKGFQAI